MAVVRVAAMLEVAATVAPEADTVAALVRVERLGAGLAGAVRAVAIEGRTERVAVVVVQAV